MSGSMIELHDVDVPTFLDLLDRCKGGVYLISDEGDKIGRAHV